MGEPPIFVDNFLIYYSESFFHPGKFVLFEVLFAYINLFIIAKTLQKRMLGCIKILPFFRYLAK